MGINESEDHRSGVCTSVLPKRMNLTHQTFTLPALSRTSHSRQPSRQVTLHSKEATKSQLINANLNYNNIQLYSVPSIGKIAEYSNNEECSSGAHTSRYQDWNKNVFNLSLSLSLSLTHTHTHTYTYKDFRYNLKERPKTKRVV